MYTSSPTTTGGSPMSAFSSAIMMRRNLNLLTANIAASGKAIIELIAKADNVTLSDLIEISIKSGFSV
jgi:tRNA U34 5-methylaminomethyl-2-thiouridine-forming methyltransferase MnmC